MQARDPFVEAEEKDGSRRPITPRREAAAAAPAPVGPVGLSGLRSDSSVLFHLDNLTSLTPAAARLPRQEMDPAALEDEGYDKTPPPTLLPADHHSGIIDLHGLQLSADTPAGAPVTPYILQPKHVGTYVPRWFWGIAAGAAAALIAVVVLTIQILTPDAAPAELAMAAPSPAVTVPASAPAARPAAALPSTATLGSSSLVATRDEDYRPRARRAPKARPSRRVARAGALADASPSPAAAPARSSGPDELDALLGRGIGGRR